MTNNVRDTDDGRVWGSSHCLLRKERIWRGGSKIFLPNIFVNIFASSNFTHISTLFFFVILFSATNPKMHYKHVTVIIILLIAGEERTAEEREGKVSDLDVCCSQTGPLLTCRVFACSHICSFCLGFSCCYSCNLSMFLLSWWIDFGASLQAQDLDTELDLLRSFIPSDR